jgi:hypothetical protein
VKSIVTWLAEWLGRWSVERAKLRHARRFEAGWKCAEHAVHDGPVAMQELQHRVESDRMFGDADGFTEGAQARLRSERL